MMYGRWSNEQTKPEITLYICNIAFVDCSVSYALWVLLYFKDLRVRVRITYCVY